MAIYYKPQSPIQSGEDFIYPITTADQIMKSDNSRRLEQAGLIVADNSTSLGGVAAGEYALKTDTAPDSSKLGGIAASSYALKTDTVSNSEKLGNVAASEYALKTYKAPDSSKLGGKAPEYYIQPRNLLDNSDFRNPVNQRNFVSGNTVTAWFYFIDRWLVSDNDACVLMDTDGLQPPIADNAWVSQRIEASKFHEGKTYTFAVRLSDGSVITASGIFPTGETDWTIFAFSENENISIRQAKFTNGHNFCQIAAKTNVTVRWAALYEGSYTSETLPPYVPKGYAVELAECQRYYRALGIVRVAGNIIHRDGRVFAYIPCYVPMRKNPSIVTPSRVVVISNVGNKYSTDYDVYYGTSDESINGISLVTTFGSGVWTSNENCTVLIENMALNADL